MRPSLFAFIPLRTTPFIQRLNTRSTPPPSPPFLPRIRMEIRTCASNKALINPYIRMFNATESGLMTRLMQSRFRRTEAKNGFAQKFARNWEEKNIFVTHPTISFDERLKTRWTGVKVVVELLVVIEKKGGKKEKNGERDQVVKGEILSKVSAIGGSMFGFKKTWNSPPPSLLCGILRSY